LDLLREIAPGLTRALVILNPDNPSAPGLLRAIKSMAEPFGVQIVSASVHNAAEIERGFDAFAPGPNSGLIVFNDLVTSVHRDLIVALASRHNMPAIYPFRSFVASAGLMAYGVDTTDMYRRAASYLDRILRGMRPEELPVQAPTKFELVINLKTAKVLGLTVSPMLLARADEVIAPSGHAVAAPPRSLINSRLLIRVCRGLVQTADHRVAVRRAYIWPDLAGTDDRAVR
jgi:putative tryptophan/tyrosine transport system substrate-binding protein